MSEESVDLVRRIFAGWSRGDFSAGSDLAAPGFEWQQHAEAVEPGLRRGGSIATALRNIFRIYRDFRIIPERYVDLGDKVLVVARNRATGRASGVELDQPFAYVWTVREGRLARLEVYSSESAALEAIRRPG